VIARLAAYYAASFASLGVFLPYWPRWLEARGVRGAAMGLATAIVPAMAIVAPVVIGHVADVLRLRAALLRVACAVAAVAFGAIALAGAGPLAGGAGEAGVAFLVGATALFALARSPMVMLADVLALEAPGGTRAYGAVRRFGSLGFLLAALFVPVLVPIDHAYAVPALVAAACAGASLAAFGLPARAVPLPRPERAALATFVATPGVKPLLVGSGLLFASHAAYDVTFSLHVRDLGLPDRWLGPAWALGVLAELVLFSRAARLVDRFGSDRLLLVGAVGGCARWCAIAATGDPFVALAIQPLHAVSFGCVWLGATGLVAARAPAGHLASAQGAFTGANAIGHATGMMVWSTVHAARGGRTVFGAAAIVAIVAAVPAWLARRT
jgi:PPP family 3-phenylpropionic acid transporter